MPKLNINPISIYLTTKCSVSKNAKNVGKICAGMDFSHYNLRGETVASSRSFFTDNLRACTAGYTIGNKANFFHENSSIYDNLIDSKPKIFKEMTTKMLDLAEKTKERVQMFLFGGWGYGSNPNVYEVDKSHNLFNNIAYFVEEVLPKTEGMEVPLTTIWGKLDSKNYDAVYASRKRIALINDAFKELFHNGKCNLSREELIEFLKQHYEEVQIPEHVHILAEENYNPYMDITKNIALNKMKSGIIA